MTIKEIIEKLHITMTDASAQESHFESWLTLNEGIIDAIDALKALDKQEPVACVQDLDEVKRKHLVYEKGMDWKDPLYTTPPKRMPLLDEEINDIAKNYALKNPTTPLHFARAIEAAHGIKGD